MASIPASNPENPPPPRSGTETATSLRTMELRTWQGRKDDDELVAQLSPRLGYVDFTFRVEADASSAQLSGATGIFDASEGL